MLTQSFFAIMFKADGTDSEASENAAPIDPLIRGRRVPSQGCTMKKVINSAPSRRHFLRLTSMAAASALAPTVLCAEQREAGEAAASQAASEIGRASCRERV